MAKKFTCENCLFYMDRTKERNSNSGYCHNRKQPTLYYQNKCIDYHFVEPEIEVFKKPVLKQLELNI